MTVNTVNGFGVNSSAYGTAGATEINLGDVYYVNNYGADKTGSADSTSAIQSAMNAASSAGGGAVYFPNGKYKVTSTLTLPANVSLIGTGYTQLLAGTGSTPLIAASASSVQQLNSFISNLEIVASAAGQNVFKFTLIDLVTIKDCVFTGCSGKIFDCDRCGYFKFSNCINRGSAAFPGGSIDLYSTSTSDYTSHWLIADYQCFNIGNGFGGDLLTMSRMIGTQVSNFTVNDCGGSGAGTARSGIVLQGDTQGVVISNPLIGAPANGITFQQDTHTSNTASPVFVDVHGANIDGATSNHISLQHGYYIKIIGGSLTSAGASQLNGNGISVGDDAGNLVISGMNLFGFHGRNAIILGSANNVAINGNVFDQTSTGIGAPRASNSYWNVQGNVFTSNVTTPIAFGSGGTTGLHNVIADNSGAPDIVRNP